MSLMSWKTVKFVFAIGRNTQSLLNKKREREKQIIEVLISSLLFFILQNNWPLM